MKRDSLFTRRGFLRSAGAVPLVAGAAALAKASPAVGGEPTAPAPPAASPGGAAAPLRVPTRPLGRTGVQVSRLSLGVDFDPGGSLLLLKRALEWGVTQWSTASDYAGGNAEVGIGRFFRRFPEDRARVHLATSGSERSYAGLARRLALSLERLGIDSIDLYYIHGIDDLSALSDEVRRFAEEQKARGRIRHFGFSSHANMAPLLAGAAALSWIDAAMVKFNYRLMQDAKLTGALRAFGEAGKGLFVMKVLGDGPIRRENPEDMRLAGHFLDRGFTPRQAAIQSVWQSPWVSAATLHADNTETLSTYVKAACDESALSPRDLDELRRHAAATRNTFCAGCARLCSEAAGGLPVADVLRFLTYANRRGQNERARRELAALPEAVRVRLAAADLRSAEAACPNRLPVAALVAEAFRRLG